MKDAHMKVTHLDTHTFQKAFAVRASERKSDGSVVMLTCQPPVRGTQ